MATQTIRPTNVDTPIVSNCSGSWSDIADDPDAPDTNFIVADSNSVSITARTTFVSPAGSPTLGSGLQEFRVYVKQFDEAKAGAPTARVELWENGVLVAGIVTSDISVPDGGIVIALAWDATELTNADGSGVECNVVGTKDGGGPSANTVNVGAIEWNVDYSTAATPHVLTSEDLASAAAIESGDVTQRIGLS